MGVGRREKERGGLFFWWGTCDDRCCDYYIVIIAKAVVGKQRGCKTMRRRPARRSMWSGSDVWEGLTSFFLGLIYECWSSSFLSRDRGDNTTATLIARPLDSDHSALYGPRSVRGAQLGMKCH